MWTVFLDACGQRNAALPDLLQLDEHSTRPVALFPTLCAVSQQTPRIAPSLLLAGLLAYEDMIRSSKKRNRVG
jgi:hypothetical protein